MPPELGILNWSLGDLTLLAGVLVHSVGPILALPLLDNGVDKGGLGYLFVHVALMHGLANHPLPLIDVQTLAWDYGGAGLGHDPAYQDTADLAVIKGISRARAWKLKRSWECC